MTNYVFNRIQIKIITYCFFLMVISTLYRLPPNWTEWSVLPRRCPCLRSTSNKTIWCASRGEKHVSPSVKCTSC